jgi:hypothetical protein
MKRKFAVPLYCGTTPQEASKPQSLTNAQYPNRNEEKLRMKRATVFTAVALLILGTAISTPAQEEPSLAHKGRVVIPESAIERPEDCRDSCAHTLPNFCARRSDEIWG